MRFVHAADLHIDSPLRGLETYEGAPVERVRRATRTALANLVRVCIEEQAAFLLVAGDLFDVDWRDFNTALFVVKQFQTLDQAGIPVYIIFGNHDASEEMSRRVPWPRNVVLFSHLETQTIPLEAHNIALHGFSYARRAVRDNLVPSYPKAEPGVLNIGLLHTSAGGSTEHATYAPCSLAELVDKGYDYWALGHIHGFQILHREPYVVYSGNTQGRHVREADPLGKGCAVVTVRDNRIVSVERRTTDVLRWSRQVLDLDPTDTLDDLYESARRRLREVRDAAPGLLSAVRLEIRGQTAAHRKLAHEISRHEAVAHLRSLAGELAGDVWLEKIKFDTRPPLDRDQLRQGHDLIGELLRDVDHLLAEPAQRAELSGLLKELTSKTAGELDANELDPADSTLFEGWLRSAEAILLSHLTDERA